VSDTVKIALMCFGIGFLTSALTSALVFHLLMR
jgi:hypothetical protein